MEVRLKDLRFDDNGLIPAIVQDQRTGDVLTLAYMNREALIRTLMSGRRGFSVAAGKPCGIRERHQEIPNR